MQIIVDGMLAHYERAGKGPVLLILPGWADTSRSWIALQTDLRKSYDVIILDMPGFGGSQAPSTAWGLAEYSGFVRQFIQKLNPGPIHAIIGHSNGGSIAIKLLSGNLLEADRLVLIASAGIRDRQKGRKGALYLAAKTGKALTAPLPRSVRQGLRARLYRQAGSDLLVAEHMQDTFKKIVAEDMQAAAPSVQVPALLLYGTEDKDTPPSFGERYAGLIPSSKLVMIPGAGHFVHVDEPAAVNKNLLEFLA